MLVVTNTAPSTHGMFGELLATSLMARGVRALVIDAGVRDTAELRAMGFAVWSQPRLVRGHREGQPRVGQRARSCSAGMPWSRPGDVVCADDDGVVVVARDEAAWALERSRERAAREDATRARLAAGELGARHLRPAGHARGAGRGVRRMTRPARSACSGSARRGRASPATWRPPGSRSTATTRPRWPTPAGRGPPRRPRVPRRSGADAGARASRRPPTPPPPSPRRSTPSPTDAVYADLATAPPALKRRLARDRRAAPGSGFADVALMAVGAPAPACARRRSPRARRRGTFVAAMAPLGMPVEHAGDEPGGAATRKLLRSVVHEGAGGGGHRVDAGRRGRGPGGRDLGQHRRPAHGGRRGARPPAGHRHRRHAARRRPRDGGGRRAC